MERLPRGNHAFEGLWRIEFPNCAIAAGVVVIARRHIMGGGPTHYLRGNIRISAEEVFVYIRVCAIDGVEPHDVIAEVSGPSDEHSMDLVGDCVGTNDGPIRARLARLCGLPP